MKTILIVDDRVINLEFLAMLLDYAGYRVIRSVDGMQALAMARAAEIVARALRAGGVGTSLSGD